MSHIRDNDSLNRFEMDVEGKVAFISYRRHDGIVSLDHTEVPPALSGRGAGSALVRGTLELASERGYKIIPHCSFIISFMRRHPEFHELLADMTYLQ
jgi:predicted GNAT family acetyltransferase